MISRTPGIYHHYTNTTKDKNALEGRIQSEATKTEKRKLLKVQTNQPTQITQKGLHNTNKHQPLS
jgi:hypothetical protein